MFKRLLLTSSIALGSMIAAPAHSSEEDFGAPEAAKAMLERAVAFMKTNPQRAIQAFNHNEKPFRDRDLFVFCFNAEDGKFTAHESFVSHDVRSLRDANGRLFGEEMYSRARPGAFTPVLFSSPVPGAIGLAPKQAYVTRVGDQVCGVSAYESSPSGPAIR